MVEEIEIERRRMGRGVGGSGGKVSDGFAQMSNKEVPRRPRGEACVPFVLPVTVVGGAYVDRTKDG